MPVGIVQVVNNTGRVLHYQNQESKFSFQLNPATDVGSSDVYIPISPYKDDTVPYKSSGNKIVVSVDGGPQFYICDDNWKLSITEDSKPEQWTNNISNGDRFVMEVSTGPNQVRFIRYIPSLTESSNGANVGLGALEQAANVAGQALQAIFL